ncbi:MAG: hypothetical protein APF81_11995 [Desulfosporosinus sp. BRH_c37]|nr:MAG: hypothetical protein APF81_11995 [Desulfosporosinus sp. BRH_c37]
MTIEKDDRAMPDNQYKESFDLLFDQVEDYLFIVDETGKIIRLNKATLEKLDYSREEIENKNVEILYPLTRGGEVQEIIKGMLEGDITKYLIPFCTNSESRYL